MSRPKSPERIQRDLDKAIRKERRERKQAEREAKRRTRLKKRLTHESVVKNGIPKVRSGGTELGIHDAIGYSPLVICAGCVEAVREILDADGLCEKCKYGKEVQEKHEGLKATGDRAPHSRGERETKPDALAGQLILKI